MHAIIAAQLLEGDLRIVRQDLAAFSNSSLDPLSIYRPMHPKRVLVARNAPTSPTAFSTLT